MGRLTASFPRFQACVWWVSTYFQCVSLICLPISLYIFRCCLFNRFLFLFFVVVFFFFFFFFVVVVVVFGGFFLIVVAIISFLVYLFLIFDTLYVDILESAFVNNVTVPYTLPPPCCVLEQDTLLPESTG